MEFHLEHPLSHSSLHNNFNDDTDYETLPHSLFLVEFQHMPSSHYFHSLKSSAFLLSNRNQAISSITQYSRKFDDPSLTYLAVNYLDRFLSSEDMPSKPWILKLISLSCVSLSAKMRKPDMSVSDLPVEGEFFDAQMIERMENVILGALKWRMRSVTPFSFLAFFISLFELKEEDPLLLKHSLKSQTSDLTFSLQHDISFLEFKPSVIAGAALLFASFELCPLQFPCFSNRINQCTYVNKDELMECYKAIQERDIIVGENEGSTETAVNVLDQQFSSCESDKSITITASSSPKRRKTSTRRY
ncbi:Cyclin D6;1 [Arabidopsis thaliana]|uniref:Cyclin D61 n=1 Tax=Arabidopsis thaliana TaxID=3702 RepID=A0A1P8B774_ARATH|nr:Cyclin D6;1 [Arabidopsis thaliana]ANM67446.1 Cyclin D6;1 [Arabidopsis thaliana]|eukprot:NP_001329275.1 Cyclin D6;1 [Arabidopsis thaliana]